VYTLGKVERVFYLDFIRAISIIFIVIVHFDASLVGHSIDVRLLSLGYIPIGTLARIGVSLFFIISGAALMYTYQNDFSIKNYFKKRFIAIYPMFWTAYTIALLYLFYTFYGINHLVPKWTFLLTIFGMDGYLLYSIPNFYILGEWFLGCIILFYVCFPILRKLLIKYPKLLIICVSIVYIVVVEKYVFKMQIDRNLLTKLPEFLFGMCFILYIKRVNVYEFVGALCISTFMIFKALNIHPMYKITIIGISSFIVLTFIGQHIKLEKIKEPFTLISKYSYAIFLVHHVVIEQMLIRFNGKKITPTESYCLFIIVCIFIAIISVCVYKISNKVSRYIKEIHLTNHSNEHSKVDITISH